MKVLVALEHHFGRGSDGAIYTAGAPHYSFWERYLRVFEEVLVVARVGDNPELEKSGRRAMGPGVQFCALPDYTGPREYLRFRPQLKEQIEEAVRGSDAYILRVPGQVGTLCWWTIKKLGRPYALEVVGDPWDIFAPGNVPGWWRPLFRRLGARTLAAMCRGATAAAYVTQEALPQRYPPGPATFATTYSDTDLTGAFVTEENLRERLRRLKELEPAGGAPSRPLRVGLVGSMAQPYKGVDTLLQATQLCGEQEIKLEVMIVGEGRFRPALEGLARQLGVDGQVRFLGQLLAGTDVYNFLDGVDIFALPSRVEGLPRALLEAMARGCPCVATSVGGVGELLPEEDRIPPGDTKALARMLGRLARDPHRLGEMARRNAEKAREYSPEILAERGRVFYDFVRRHAHTAERAGNTAGDWVEFSIHGLVRLALPKTFPHGRALRHELEHFEVAPTGPWDILVAEPREAARFADSTSVLVDVLNPRSPSTENGVFFLLARNKVVVGCSRDPTPYYLLLVAWLLLLKGAALVHAAAVAVKGRGVLLPALGGVGKTAAVKALCQAGGAFLADDLVILSEKGELFSFPKPLFLYPYHRALFPHVFERKTKFVVPSWLTRPVAEVRQAVRPLLRAFPRLEDFARRYTPEYLLTPVRQALPGVEIVPRAALALTLFLERSPRAKAELALMEKKELAAKMTKILHAELPEPARQALTACSAAGQISLSDFLGRMESVISGGVASSPAYRLVIPASYGAAETAALVEEKVNLLLGPPAQKAQ